MKIIKTNRILIFVSVFESIICSAQTINAGKLYVTSGTILSTVGVLDNKTTGDLINDGTMYIYNHYNNDGMATFTPAAIRSKTLFVGQTGYQDITGSMPIECFDVEFNNNNAQPAFHLSNTLSIAGLAEFSEGVIDDNLYKGLVVFEENATHYNVNDRSHVNGNVLKNGKKEFQFPIGDAGRYRYASISAPDNAGDAFTAKYFLENSNLLYPHNSKSETINLIDNTEYWTIEKTAGSSNVLLTLTWNDNTTPSALYAEPYEEIHIVRWDAIKNIWVDEGGAADYDAKEVSMIVAPEDGYGIFTLARVKTNTILPCNGKQVVVYNAVSPNGDGFNDSFTIEGID
jgi:hypothetical protein